MLKYQCRSGSLMQFLKTYRTHSDTSRAENALLLSWYSKMIIDHTHPNCERKRQQIGAGKYNGAYYYSKEIVENIIPRVQTDRNWITILVPHVAVDHSIVFIHNNLHPEYYDYLKPYKDIILVCGIQKTAEVLEERIGHKAIYLPLSVDTDYVKQFIRPKTKDTAYAGRLEKVQYMNLPTGIDYLHGIKREVLLPTLAQYKNVYAVGRTAIEGKILGCNILNADKRYLHTDWQILDNKDAAVMLQEKINEIDL